METSIGQTLNNLVSTLPQIVVLAFMYKLIFNELFHIIIREVEPEKVKNIEEEIKTAREKEAEILSAYISLEPIRRMIDRWAQTEGKEIVEQVRKIIGGE